MKSVFLLLFLLSSHALPSSADDRKPDKSLSFTFNKFHQKDTLKFAECTLRNNTDTLFWILAYDTSRYEGKRYIHLLYSLQEKKNGKWKDSDLGFSGVGIEKFSFSPGEEFLFATPDFDSTAEAIKIGTEIRIRSNDDRLRTLRTIWTDEIKLR